jgi:hypothetical protein
MATKVQGTKTRQAAAMKEQDTLTAVKDLSMDSVTDAVSTTQVEVQQALASVSASLTQQLQKLRSIEDAIQLRREELNRLHSIEVTASTLDDLQAEIGQTREQWEDEEAAKKRLAAEQQSERNKQWKREEEDYLYRKQLEHRKLEDAFSASMAQQEKANREKQEQLEKQWTEREAELKKREQELAELRLFKDNHPEVVKKEVNAAVAVATNSVKKEYETKIVLAAKDSETDKRLAEQEIRSLNETIKKQQIQLDDLKEQVARAQADVKEISGKALDSASGRATTEALQRLMEKEPAPTKATK